FGILPPELKKKPVKFFSPFILTMLALVFIHYSEKPVTQPNIVIIYADDMGYGDLHCQNPGSKIPTPNLDQLASEGMRFTDAHSSSGICSPSRFALLTGTYHWRRQHGIVGAFGKPFFLDSDFTLPQMLKKAGYTTACFGKWHLGWDWQFQNAPTAEVEQWGRKVKYYLPEDLDWTKPIAGGLLARGFDHYFGDGTINFPPYAWVEDDRILKAPTATMDIHDVGYEVKEGAWEFRPGPKEEDWNPYKVLPTLTTRTVEWIKKRKSGDPFFLYFALPSPHAPIIPNDEFDGRSEAGAYGDFMVQTDWVVGQVLRALHEQGLDDNTMVIFSADNGPEAYAWERAAKYGHFSMGDFRGLKRDVWEGGHHVPFLARWPGHIEPGSVSDEVISQVDVMATVARITGINLPENAAPDSYDLTAVLLGQSYSSPLREATVHNTYESKWGIRKGDWLYINSSSGGHRELPDFFKKLRGYTDFDTEGILFNMKEDPGQRINLYSKYPDKIKELEHLLDNYRQQGYSVLRSGNQDR
ncbi:MAG: arylsulfatase, partial [Saprospiraceae bacterium]|nr:arylsulfatase [Saprospiraceae bacterium]